MASKEQIGLWRKKLKALENERKKGWEGHWRDLARYFMPRRSRFLDAGERTNEGDERNRLFDGVGIVARRTLAAGMQSGLTSPARPWFSLTLQDEEIARQTRVVVWLYYVYKRMMAVFARSNFYDQVHLLYDELGTFGTGVMLVEEDEEATLRCRTLTAGESCLDVNASGRVDTLYRRVRMTARQIVEAWPETAPDKVKELDRRGNGQWLEVVHLVEPDPDFREGNEAAVRPWRSVYMMANSDDLLEESGYYEFPALCPRWNTTGSDIYGESPAMDALGDCRLLQKLEEDGLIALEKEVNPPLAVAKSDGLGRVIDTSPGAVNYVSPLAQGQSSIQSLYQVRANLAMLEQVKEQKRRNVRESFYNDLFLMVSQVNRQMTATEVAERNSEKMLLLGPVLDRLRSELFQPLIVRVFGIMTRLGMVPVPPEELQGQEIKIEFISILAQAQKQAGIASINNTVAFVANVAQFNQEALDKLNIDEAVDEVAEMNGVPPSLIRSNEEVAELREVRQQQIQQMQMMEAMKGGADIAATGARAVKDLGLSEAMAGMGGDGESIQ